MLLFPRQDNTIHFRAAMRLQLKTHLKIVFIECSFVFTSNLGTLYIDLLLLLFFIVFKSNSNTKNEKKKWKFVFIDLITLRVDNSIAKGWQKRELFIFLKNIFDNFVVSLVNRLFSHSFNPLFVTPHRSHCSCPH